MRPLAARVALVAVSLALVELGFRAAGVGSERERAGLLERVEGWREPDQGGGVAEQELTYPSLDPFIGFTTVRLAWRLSQQAGAFDDDTYDIVVVGGSVAVGLASLAAEDLAEPVRADPRFAGRKVRVVNLARGGFKQPQQLHLVSQALTHGWRPDAVVNLDGFNELALGVQNALDHDTHPFWPAFSSLGPLMRAAGSDPAARRALVALEIERRRARALGGPLPLGLHHSAAVRAFASAGLRGTVGRFEHARDDYLERVRAAEPPASPPFEPGFESALELSVRNWFESSRSLHALCAERGIAYLHVLQPTLHDEGSKPLTEAEVAAGATGPETWIRAVRAGYPLLREASARLAALGVPFHDASRVFEHDQRELYYDVCHFGAPGQYALAADIGAALVRTLP